MSNPTGFPTYVVTADADNLAGWTSHTLAVALEQPLAVEGVTVSYEPHQHGGGGLVGYAPEIDGADLPESVQRIVESVVTG